MRHSVRAAVALGCAAPLLAAAADRPASPPDRSTVPVDQIVVTGTRIPRRDFFATSPIVTVDRSEIELAGTSELKNLLNDLPQVDPTADAGTSNAFGGESFINLRALGANRTLVLLNGRRYPSQGISGAVDINPVPPGLIERVEIITGGASAVYGSDALAGAVNFVFRDDFSGLESNLQYGQTTHGDAERYTADIAFGTPFAGDRGRLIVFADYFRREKVLQNARAFSANNITGNDDTGELFVFNSFASDSGSIAGIGPFYTFEPDGTPRLFVEPDDRFSLAPFNALLAPMERYSANSFASYDLTDSTRLRVEYTYARSRPEQLVADEFFQFVDVNVDRPDLAPAFRDLLMSDADPDGDGIATVFLGRTFSPERGTGGAEYDTDFHRGLIAIDGETRNDWFWTVDVSYASNDRDTDAPNDLSVSRIQQGLLVDPVTGGCVDPSRGCVPVNPFGAGNLSSAAANFIGLSGTEFTEHSSELFVTAQLRGTPIEYRPGSVEVALGAEYRRFRFRNEFPNDNLQAGDSLFFPVGITPTSGKISVGEAYAEARVPLLSEVDFAEYLGLDVGARVSDYNTLDDPVWTWKLGAEWRVTKGFALRAMQQHAIRAPGMSDLFQSVNFAFTDVDFGPAFDECSASRDPVGNGLAELCIAQGIPADQIGVYEASLFPTAVSVASNPDAQPEEADTFTVGFVWQPERMPGISLSVDYFDIEIDDALASADYMDFARLCFLSRDPNNPACQTFTRAPSGDIATGLNMVINSAVATSEGIDFAIDYTSDTFGATLLATHYLEAGSQGSVLLPFLDCAGKFGAFCNLSAYQGAVPDWRVMARLTYATGPLVGSLRWTYIGGLTNAEAEFRATNNQPPGMLAVPTAPSVDYVDATLAWEITTEMTLSFGIENVFDEDPPLLGSASRGANTDPTTYDLLGRRYFVRAQLKL